MRSAIVLFGLFFIGLGVWGSGRCDDDPGRYGAVVAEALGQDSIIGNERGFAAEWLASKTFDLSHCHRLHANHFSAFAVALSEGRNHRAPTKKKPQAESSFVVRNFAPEIHLASLGASAPIGIGPGPRTSVFLTTTRLLL